MNEALLQIKVTRMRGSGIRTTRSPSAWICRRRPDKAEKAVVRRTLRMQRIKAEPSRTVRTEMPPMETEATGMAGTEILSIGTAATRMTGTEMPPMGTAATRMAGTEIPLLEAAPAGMEGTGIPPMKAVPIRIPATTTGDLRVSMRTAGPRSLCMQRERKSRGQIKF